MADISTRVDGPTASSRTPRPSAGARPAPQPVQLTQLVERSGDLASIASHLVRAAAETLSANAVAYYHRDPQGHLVVMAETSQHPTPWSTPELVQLCQTATEQQVGVGRRALTSRQEQGIAVAVPGSPAPHDAMLALLSKDSVRPEAAVVLELIANGYSQWRLQQSMRRLDWEARTSSAVAELVRNVGASDSLRAASFLIANELARHFQCDQVAVALAKPNRAGTEVEAISGRGEFDRKSEVTKSMEQALNESVVRGHITVWPPLDGSDRHATLAHRRFTAISHMESVVSAPLISDEGNTIGAFLLSAPREVLHDKQRLDAIRTIAPHLATALQAKSATEPGQLRRLWYSIAPKADTARRHRLLVCALLIAIIPVVPLRYNIKTNCIVEPTARHFAVAPYDGILRETYVEPGEVVTKGQLLARMEDREIRWELSGLSAEAVRAGKKRDVAMAEHNTPDAQMAQLERERLELKIALLRNRQENLEIHSELEGAVLKGGLEDVQGAPVRIGQSLFEVAPLKTLRLEVAIPESDIAYVEAGQKVTARIDGAPSAQICGLIDRIRPRAEVRDGQNVFVAQIEVDNSQRRLLPGMSGRAKVVGQRKIIGWIVFHKAWHRLRNLVGV